MSGSDQTSPTANDATGKNSATNVVQELGWGRVVFGQTFDGFEELRDVLRGEESGRRDICMYLPDPHVLVAMHPSELFIDPSHTFRMDLHAYQPRDREISGVRVREVATKDDCEVVNRIYARCRMVPASVEVMWRNHTAGETVVYLVAEDEQTGEVIGTVTGIDHGLLFDDPENGYSLWSLAVDPSTTRTGVGELLVRELLTLARDRGCDHLDLSVIHNNTPAINLYKAMGFERVPVLSVKRKNAINEPLFTGSEQMDDLDKLNPYARIIADEAIRRGIRVDVLDADTGYMQLQHGGRTVITRESLSQYTTAIAMSRCDDKRITRKVVGGAGVRVPRGRDATFDRGDHEFLAEVGAVVVKPVRGEQGAGITVRVRTDEELEAALARAGGPGAEILIEEHVEGEDLRVIVIDGQVIAAAIRRPPSVTGDGKRTVAELVTAQSRRREAATGGESRIPLDELTETTVREEGWKMDDVPPAGTQIQVRRTANLHTGGTIHDVTDELHPDLGSAAVAAAEAIGISVTGIDLLVPDVTQPEFVFIEANERPGLSNHEPRPTSEAFVDYLFPRTKATAWAWKPMERRGEDVADGDHQVSDPEV